MHHLTLLFAAGLISTISAAPLPAATDALLDFQERANYVDDDVFAQVARSLDALEQGLEERGPGGKITKEKPFPKPPKGGPKVNIATNFRRFAGLEERGPGGSKITKDKPVPKPPKVPNPQPKTINTIQKPKPGPKPNPATNFRRALQERGPGGSKITKDKPVPKPPKVPNPQPKTINTIQKPKPGPKPNPATNFRRFAGLEERGPGGSKITKDKPVPKPPKVPNPQPKTINTIQKPKPGPKPNPATNFRRYEVEVDERDEEFFDERDEDVLVARGPGGSKITKDKPVPKPPKVPNPQPKTINTIQKPKPGPKPNPATNFRRYEVEVDERDEEVFDERDVDFLDERDEEFLDERDEEFLDERDEEFLDERDEEFYY